MASSTKLLSTSRLALMRPVHAVRQITKKHYNTTARRLCMETGQRHHPSNFDKRILVWAKVHKSVADVPEYVTFSTMNRAKDWFRIRMNIYMALVTACMCGVYIFIGRKSAREGDSLEKRGRDWHRKNKEEYEKQQAAAKDSH